jgi:hypothetical protein
VQPAAFRQAEAIQLANELIKTFHRQCSAEGLFRRHPNLFRAGSPIQLFEDETFHFTEAIEAVIGGILYHDRRTVGRILTTDDQVLAEPGNFRNVKDGW